MNVNNIIDTVKSAAEKIDKEEAKAKINEVLDSEVADKAIDKINSITKSNSISKESIKDVVDKIK